ncbi:MAG: sugar transferase [Calditrichaeota bacterium]|nr:MAG: sugar transferase [Calditrichota bacterium]MBL1204591.1 sugar transferase [Calditrichota bacterium]NOG44420.1 sugar transferase [Calditrichota bacterium]
MKKPSFIKKNWDSLVVTWLFFGDLIAFNASFLLAQYIRFSTIKIFDQYFELVIVINILFFLISSFTGLYRGIARTSLTEQKEHLRKFAFYTGLVLMSYLYLIKGSEYSRGVMIIFVMLQYIVLDVLHTITFKVIQSLNKRNIGSKSTLIVGADDSAIEFYYNLKMNFDYGYDIKGFLRNGHPRVISEKIKDKILGHYEDINGILDQNGIDRVFIVSDSMYEPKYVPIRKACDDKNIKLKMVSPQTLSLINQFHVKDITGVPLTTQSYRTRYNKSKITLKRVFDLFVAITGMLLISPFFMLISLLIKLTSKGPVFFKQTRSLSASGETFEFIKFRTMYTNAEEIKEKLMDQNETNGALFKMKDDPRVTMMGKFLRKYSLDELPQLINVLKGEMSLVGPRPLPIKDFSNIENGKINYDWYEKRSETKPGITGLWQISGRSNLTFEEMVMLDLYYIENQSLVFDLEILFDTIPIVLTGKGAY